MPIDTNLQCIEGRRIWTREIVSSCSGVLVRTGAVVMVLGVQN